MESQQNQVKQSFQILFLHSVIHFLELFTGTSEGEILTIDFENIHFRLQGTIVIPRPHSYSKDDG